MKIIINKFIPFEGFKMLTAYPFLFVREGSRYTEKDINHEEIHAQQQKELLFLGFYIIYILEWFVKLFFYIDGNKAYRNISFEREAYSHEKELDYLANRKKFSFIKYIRL